MTEVVQVCGTKSVNDALRAFGHLKDLKTLESRNLKGYIDIDWVKNTKKEWAKVKWVFYG